MLQLESIKCRRAKIFGKLLSMCYVKALLIMLQPESKKWRAKIFCNFVCMCYVKGLLLRLQLEQIKRKRTQFYVYVLLEKTPYHATT